MTSAALAERFAGRRDAAARRAAAGEAVIGIVGRDVPPALVAAAGGAPFRIPVEDGDIDEAASYLGRAIDRAALDVAAAVLDGRLDFLRGLLVAHDSEGSLRLFYALRELHRRERVRIPVHLVDQVHLPRASTLRFNTAQLESMLATVSAWTGSAVSRGSIADAWARHAAVHAALGALRASRGRAGGADGLDALRAYAVAAAAPDDGAVADIRAAAAAPPPDAADADAARPRVLLTGSAPIGDHLYCVIESTGAVIVGEDHDWGDPILSDAPAERPPSTAAGAAEAAARSRLEGAPAAASGSMAARAAATADAVRRTGAVALLGVIRSHDDAPAWDWGRQRAAAGVPAALVRGPEADDDDAVRAAIATLAVRA